MARRVCFALDLIADADLIADYERAHAAGAVWPDVTDAIRAKGFEAMENWPRAIPSDLAVTDARWEAAMDRFQKPLPHAAPGEKWVAMKCIYSLDDQ